VPPGASIPDEPGWRCILIPVVMAVGDVRAYLSRPNHKVFVTTTSGDKRVLWSKDGAFMDRAFAPVETGIVADDGISHVARIKGNVQMTFQQVIAALRHLRPAAELGLTAQRGKYYDQAIHMAFHRREPLVYCASGARGKEMWVYFSEKVGRICCGNKS
jgi:hypothetical protein